MNPVGIKSWGLRCPQDPELSKKLCDDFLAPTLYIANHDAAERIPFKEPEENEETEEMEEDSEESQEETENDDKIEDIEESMKESSETVITEVIMKLRNEPAMAYLKGEIDFKFTPEDIYMATSRTQFQIDMILADGGNCFMEEAFKSDHDFLINSQELFGITP